MHRRTNPNTQNDAPRSPSAVKGAASTTSAAFVPTTTTTPMPIPMPNNRQQHQRRPPPPPPPPAASINGNGNGNGNANGSSSIACPSSPIPPPPPPNTTATAQRRRRKVKSTAFSRHYGGKSSNSNSIADLPVWFLMFLVVVLVVAILIAIYIAWDLLQTAWSSQQHPLFTSKKISKETFDATHHHSLPDQFRNRKDTSNNNEDYDDNEHYLPPLKESDIYIIPNSMSHIGDKSDQYAAQRQAYDEEYPYNPERSLQATRNLWQHTYEAFDNPLYDIHNCPDEPPDGYPYQWKTLTIVNHWNPHDTPEPPIPVDSSNNNGNPKIYQGLCIFDYRKDYLKALKYRRAEVPFVVRGDPRVAQTVERWSHPTYVHDLMGNVQHRAEYSINNHFMFWMPANAETKNNNNKHGRPGKKPIVEQHVPKDWQQPTELIRMTYRDWLQKANVSDLEKTKPDQPHWYFRLIGCGETGPTGECDRGSSEYLFDELPFFQPRPDGLYLVDADKQKGIHCRFGMRGVIAENHFDASRNAIVLLGGERRYILSSPDQCRNLALFPKGHPSSRHSQVDWSQPDLDEFPEFGDAMSNEIVLQAGDVLYLPQNWFHYIVSLNVNYQCNTRSGTSSDYWESIHQCGF